MIQMARLEQIVTAIVPPVVRVFPVAFDFQNASVDPAAAIPFDCGFRKLPTRRRVTTGFEPPVFYQVGPKYGGKWNEKKNGR